MNFVSDPSLFRKVTKFVSKLILTSFVILPSLSYDKNPSFLAILSNPEILFAFILPVNFVSVPSRFKNVTVPLFNPFAPKLALVLFVILPSLSYDNNPSFLAIISYSDALPVFNLPIIFISVVSSLLYRNVTVPSELDLYLFVILPSLSYDKKSSVLPIIS